MEKEKDSLFVRPDKKVLVLGIGNILMADEGIGVKIVQFMEHHYPHPDIQYLDGGTGGFHLLEYFQQHPVVLIIDAVQDDAPLGHLSFRKPQFSSDYPPTLTAHDIGLKDLLDALYLLQHRPTIILATITIPTESTLSVSLNSQLASQVSQYAQDIYHYLLREGIINTQKGERDIASQGKGGRQD